MNLQIEYLEACVQILLDASKMPPRSFDNKVVAPAESMNKATRVMWLARCFNCLGMKAFDSEVSILHIKEVSSVLP